METDRKLTDPVYVSTHPIAPSLRVHRRFPPPPPPFSPVPLLPPHIHGPCMYHGQQIRRHSRVFLPAVTWKSAFAPAGIVLGGRQHAYGPGKACLRRHRSTWSSSAPSLSGSCQWQQASGEENNYCDDDCGAGFSVSRTPHCYRWEPRRSGWHGGGIPPALAKFSPHARLPELAGKMWEWNVKRTRRGPIRPLLTPLPYFEITPRIRALSLISHFSRCWGKGGGWDQFASPPPPPPPTTSVVWPDRASKPNLTSTSLTGTPTATSARPKHTDPLRFPPCLKRWTRCAENKIDVLQSQWTLIRGDSSVPVSSLCAQHSPR